MWIDCQEFGHLFLSFRPSLWNFFYKCYNITDKYKNCILFWYKCIIIRQSIHFCLKCSKAFTMWLYYKLYLKMGHIYKNLQFLFIVNTKTALLPSIFTWIVYIIDSTSPLSPCRCKCQKYFCSKTIINFINPFKNELWNFTCIMKKYCSCCTHLLKV